MQEKDGIVGFIYLITRIYSFRRESKEEILAALEAVRLQHGQQYLIRCAGIGRALQYYELATLLVFCYGLHGTEYIRYVRLPSL